MGRMINEPKFEVVREGYGPFGYEVVCSECETGEITQDTVTIDGRTYNLIPQGDIEDFLCFNVELDENKDLWHFRKRAYTNKTIDFDALSADELRRLQNQERQERSRLMEKLVNTCNPEKNGVSFFDLLPPPKYI